MMRATGVALLLALPGIVSAQGVLPGRDRLAGTHQNALPLNDQVVNFD